MNRTMNDDTRQLQDAYKLVKNQLRGLQTARDGLLTKINRCQLSNKAAMARGDYAGVDLKAQNDLNDELQQLDTIIEQTQARASNCKKLWQDATNPTLQSVKIKHRAWHET